MRGLVVLTSPRVPATPLANACPSLHARRAGMAILNALRQTRWARLKESECVWAVGEVFVGGRLGTLSCASCVPHLTSPGVSCTLCSCSLVAERSLSSMQRRAREDGFAVRGGSATASPDGSATSAAGSPSPVGDPLENVTPAMMAVMLAQTEKEVEDLDTLPGGALHGGPTAGVAGIVRGRVVADLGSGDDAAVPVKPLAPRAFKPDLAVVTAKSPRARSGRGQGAHTTRGRGTREAASRPRSVRFAPEADRR